MAMYYVTFFYPDGHVEEIEGAFNSLESAKDYGENLLNQVEATEQLKKQGIFSSSGLAYFTVKAVENGERKTVYLSRK